jgi:hypothetical protein
MSRAKTPAAEAVTPTNFADLPYVVALLGLASAVAAVARFPNTPVPDALVDRITQAEQDLKAALTGEAIPAVAAAPGAAYDDAWIRDTFKGLEKALDERFAGLKPAEPPAAYDDKWIHESFAELNDTLKARFEALDAAIAKAAPADAADKG